MPGTRGLTIALAGGVGSGKSTIARELAAKLDGVVASFGDYVRHIAGEAGEPADRLSLQRVGQELVDADTPGFVRSFLKWASPPPGRSLIIDGVRHAAVDNALRAWAEASNVDYALIVLNASTRERAERRHNGDQDEIRRIDDHPVERESVELLPRHAEVLVNASGSLCEVIARIAAAAPEPIARRLR